MGHVLPVAADGQSGGVAASRMGPEGRLHHRKDAVPGDTDAVPEALEVVDHALDGRHDAPASRPGAPDAIEERLGEDEVARGVGGRGVDERHIGHQRLEQAQRAEGRIDDGKGLVVRHGGTDQ